MAKDKKNTILMIGGSGPDLPMIRSLVEKLGLQKKVHFLGFIPDDELVEVTPKSIRLRKRFLKETDRKRVERSKAG